MSKGPFLRKYGVETTINFDLFEVDGVDFRVDAAHATGDTKIMKDEGAEANTTNGFTDEGQGYSIVLTATEMQAARIKVYIVDSATKAWLDTSFTVETYGNASAMHAFDLDTATQDVNAIQISGDSTAADNLELMYDGTGYTDDTAPASRSQVSGIGTGGSGALNYPVAFDNTTTDTIDNAAAVDKGDGTVGIPVTGHAFVAGREVTIAGTTNYNGAYTIVSQTTNEVVITETFASETFAGTETIVDSIEGITFTGSVGSGTFATTESNPATYHQIDHSGNAINIVYAIDLGDTKTGIQCVINAYLNGSNDEINIQVFDHDGDDWETFSSLSGTNGSTNTEITLNLFEKHTSPIGTTNAGFVYLRFTCTAQSSPQLNVATIVTSAASSISTMGYQVSRVWANEATGTSTGTTLGVDGTFANQCDDFDNAQTIADSLGTSFINIHPGDSITLSAALEGYVISMVQATVDGGSQNTGSTRFNEGTYVGTFARSSGFPSFADGRIFGPVTTVTMPQFVACRCSVVGTLTFSEAANQTMIDCQAAATPTLDCGSLGSGFILNLVEWRGNASFTNLAADAVVNLVSSAAGDITINGAGGTVNIWGSHGEITDSSGGSVTINDNGMDTEDVAAILVDTGTTLNDKIDVIDGIVDDLKLGVILGAAATGTLAIGSMTTDLTGYADDQLIGRIVTFTSGDAEGEIVNISDYASTGGLVTFAANLTTAPANGDTFKIT